jgi:uncharacterized protein (TIGR02246 family)
MRVLGGLVMSLLILGQVTALSAGEKDSLMQEVAALGDALAQAMLEDDIDTMLGMYTDDAISLPNFGPRMEGKDAFRKHHDEMAAAGMKIKSFSSDPTNVWAVANQVVEIGVYKIAIDMPGAPETIEDVGKYMTVYVREPDGSLKIKAETWNTDMNPMEMGEPEQ